MKAVEKNAVLIVLSSFRAEGTPLLAIELCRHWLSWGISPYILSLERFPPQVRSEFEKLGVTIALGTFKEVGYRRYPKLSYDVFKTCRWLHPKAVLSMPSGIHAFIAMGARAAGVSRIAVHQGSYPFHWKILAFRKYWLEYQLGRPFTGTTVSCSRYVDHGVAKHLHLKDSERTVVYNGIDLAKFEAVAQERALAMRSKEQEFTVAMVGRLDGTKDQATLIRAVGLLRKRSPRLNVKLLLVGDGANRLDLEGLSRHCGVEDDVEFLGVRSDIPRILGESDLFVYSVNRDEGLGIALIEAMAAGVPVVASNVQACREVLAEGQAGFIVPEQNPAAMADAMEHVLNDADATAARARHAKRRAKEVFSAEAMARSYAKILGVLPQSSQDERAPRAS